MLAVQLCLGYDATAVCVFVMSAGVAGAAGSVALSKDSLGATDG